MKKNPTKWKKLSLLALVTVYGVSLIVNLFATAWLGFVLWALAIASLVIFSKSTKSELTEARERYTEAVNSLQRQFEELGGAYNDNNPDPQE